MLNYVEYPSSVKEGTETPGAFDQNGQRFYVLDRLQEQASRIRYLLDTTVFFRNQLETCQAAGNAEAAQSTYLSLSSGRIGIANGVRSLKPLLLELEHPAASICEALVDQISSFELMTRDYSKFSGVISRFLDALPSYHTLAVRQTKESVSVVVWYPRLRADLSLYKTPYPDFPIPRLVFGFSVGAADGAVSACRIGVIADETPTPDTIMYRYPFSNVDSSGSLCIGANTLPKYKELRKAAGLPALLISIPNNFDRFDPSDNQLGLDYRDLMQHLKDKEPAYYYTDILIPNGQTLAHFIQRM